MPSEVASASSAVALVLRLLARLVHLQSLGVVGHCAGVVAHAVIGAPAVEVRVDVGGVLR